MRYDSDRYFSAAMRSLVAIIFFQIVRVGDLGGAWIAVALISFAIGLGLLVSSVYTLVAIPVGNRRRRKKERVDAG